MWCRSKGGFSLIELLAGAALLAAAFFGLTMAWETLARSASESPEYSRAVLRDAAQRYLAGIDWNEQAEQWTAVYALEENVWSETGEGTAITFRVVESTPAFRRVEVLAPDNHGNQHWIPLIVAP